MTSYRPPIKFRVPNPPPLFVGREAELRATLEALERGPVVVLVGGGGMGKSGLARIAAQHFDRQAERPTTQVQLRPDDSLGATLARLNAVLGGAPLEASEGLEAVMEATLFAAESVAAVVVVEDLHHASDDAVSACLEMVSSYARRSRWIATTRRGDVSAGLREQVVRLGPLEAEAVAQLVAKCAPQAGSQSVDRIVELAGGSPLEARRLAVGSEQVQASGGHERGLSEPVLTQVPEAARPLLEALAQTTLPLELGDVGAAVTLPAGDVLELLAMAGILVSEGGQRVRLHDAVRGRIASEIEPERAGQVRQALTRGLAEQADPDAVLEAIRSGLDDADKAPVKGLLERRWNMLVEEGRADRVWRLLRHQGFEFRQLAMRAALATGTPEALRWAALEPAPPPEELHLRYRWLDARRRMAVGFHSLLQDALTLAEGARDAGDERLVFDAVLMGADVAYSLGQLDTTAELIASIDGGVSDTTGLVRRDALHARICEIRGEHEEAASWAQRARQRAEALEPVARLAALRRCHFVTVVAQPSEAPEIPTDSGFWPCFLAGIQACFNGDGDKGQAAYAAVSAMDHSNVTETVMAELLGMFRGLVVGETSALYTSGVTALHRARVARDWVGLQWGILGHSIAAWAAVKPAGEVEWPEDMPKPGAAIAGLITLIEDLHRLDLDPDAVPLRVVPAALGEPDRASVPLDMADALGHSLFALLMEQYNESLVASARAVRLATAPGMKFVEFTVRSAQLFTFAAMGREADLQRGVEAYADLVQRMRSPFAQRGVAFMEAVFGAQLQVAVLEALAEDWEGNAIAAHWSRILLSGSLPPRRSHRMVATILTDRFKHLEIERYGTAGGEWRRGWGLDLVQRQAWRVDGQVIDLSRRKTMRRLLTTLAEGGGKATKEELVERVWDTEYHPLRDDTKLQVSVGRLRKLLGDSSDAPVHIITVEGGYSIGPIPFAVVRPVVEHPV